MALRFRSDLGVALQGLRAGPIEDSAAAVAIGPFGNDEASVASQQRVGLSIDSSVLNAAVTANWRPYSWTLWRTWRGDVDLLFHVGRTVRWALADSNASAATTVHTTIWTGAVTTKNASTLLRHYAPT